MCSHQTSRTSQISHFRIKYKVGISFRKAFSRAILEKLDKKTEALAQRCSVKKVFLEISQNSQVSACARAFFFS